MSLPGKDAGIGTGRLLYSYHSKGNCKVILIVPFIFQLGQISFCSCPLKIWIAGELEQEVGHFLLFGSWFQLTPQHVFRKNEHLTSLNEAFEGSAHNI